MKTWMSLAGTVVTLCLAACISPQLAPDPELIKEQIAASKAEELRLVRATITENERAERFVLLLEERERLFRRYSAEISEYRRKLNELNADYAAERADFENLIAAYNRKRASAQEEVVELIARMKQATTADEWATISAFQTERLNPRMLVHSDSEGES
jgi:septal ring factor EnvC (AmiA/AmiB activator)